MESPEEDTLWLAPPQCCDVVVHIVLPSSPHPLSPTIEPPLVESDDNRSKAPSVLLVHATSQILSKIPYFSSRLSPPWRNQDDPRPVVTRLTLENITSSPPSAYRRCLELLRPSSICCSPYMFKSLSEALELLPAADHLLFKDCADACMQYLAAVSWSPEQEDSIRSTISNLGLEPSSDLQERLDSSKAADVLKEVIADTLLLDYGPVSHTTLENFLRPIMQSSSGATIKTTSDILIELWMARMEDCVKQWTHSTAQSLQPVIEWLQLTKVVVNWTDAREVVEALANCQDFPKVLKKAFDQLKKAGRYRGFTTGNFGIHLYDIICGVLEKVGDGRVILRNAARSSLVREWFPLLGSVCSTKSRRGSRETISLSSILQTLPFEDPAVVEFMKGCNICFVERECYKWWCERLERGLTAVCTERPPDENDETSEA